MRYPAKLKRFYATTSLLALLSVNLAAPAEAATIDQSVHKVVRRSESEFTQVNREAVTGAPHAAPRAPFVAQATNVTSVNYHPDVQLVHQTVEPVVYRSTATPVQQSIHRDLYQAHQAINRDVAYDAAQAHRQIDQQVAQADQQLNWETEARHDWEDAGPHWHGSGWGTAAGLFAGLAIGASLASLPVNAQPILANGSSYYYANGAYFVPVGAEYRVVLPPLGAIVPVLPPGYVTLYDSYSRPYYYDNGVFYRTGSQGYAVVAPPAGVAVPYLPKGATSVVINGIPYYRYAGVTYQPDYSSGTAVYAVVKI